MRASGLFMPTVKEDPADAEAISHKLMVRGGFVRQFASGIYVMLPLGWRVMQRICRIIREEMDRIGAVELSMPTLHPADVWQASGRYQAIGQEMFRLKDRGGRDMVLAMTHEEVFAWLAGRELRSYRDLPQIWYQIQLKFRDEPRPKGGVLRVREFLMKDSYSFDLDEAGLETSYARHIEAYDRIFARCGLQFLRVESDSGFMGGAQAHEYMAPSVAGEDRVAVCAACGFAANVELARSIALFPAPSSWAGQASDAGALPEDTAAGTGSPPEVSAPREVATPDKRTIAEVSAFLGLEASDLIKALVYVADGSYVVALVRGDHELHENKLSRYLGTAVRPAHPEEVLEATGSDVGFVGPVGLRERGLRLVADEALDPKGPAGPRAYAAGANKPHTHLWGVVVGRDFTPEYADLREAQEGEGCPQCGQPLSVRQVIEIGNIFKLGTKYSLPLGAVVLDEKGQERPIVMGSYGIGPARIAAAAVEQNHDERGIVWPKAIAPFDFHVVQVQAKDEVQTHVAAAVHRELENAGFTVLWDDRDERPGFKFADAELIGCPVRVTVGKKAAEGRVEIELRSGGDRLEIPVDRCLDEARLLWEQAK